MNWPRIAELLERYGNCPGLRRYWRIYIAFILGLMPAIAVGSIMTPNSILFAFGFGIGGAVIGLLWQARDTSFR